MGFSQTTIATIETVDQQAPGAPGLSIIQTSDNTGDFTLTPPTRDSDGSPLDGLTYGQAVVLQSSAEEAEAYRNDFDAALVANGAQVFTFDMNPTDSSPIIQSFNIASPGKPYSVIARCADHDKP